LKLIPIFLCLVLSAFVQISSAQSGTTSDPQANPGRPTVFWRELMADHRDRLYPAGSCQCSAGARCCTLRQSTSILLSDEVYGFHFDANGIVTDQIQGLVHRAQFGQTLSIFHLLGKFTISGEVWHFSQPFEHGHAVGNLWAVSYSSGGRWGVQSRIDQDVHSMGSDRRIYVPAAPSPLDRPSQTQFLTLPEFSLPLINSRIFLAESPNWVPVQSLLDGSVRYVPSGC
jgi:hypothetical protein